MAPSRWYENTPFVVLGASAGGVPVIATDLGGTAEIIDDGNFGDLFRRDDAADSAHKLERLANEPERLARYRDALPEVKTIEQNADEIEAKHRSLSS